jgi:hypothetical protein
MTKIANSKRSVFDKPVLSDLVVLKCGPKSFAVHKTILVTGSRYFSELLRKNPEVLSTCPLESAKITDSDQQSEVQLPGDDTFGVEIILEFLYGSRFIESNGNYGDLQEFCGLKQLALIYVEADRYEMPGVKENLLSVLDGMAGNFVESIIDVERLQDLGAALKIIATLKSAKDRFRGYLIGIMVELIGVDMSGEMHQVRADMFRQMIRQAMGPSPPEAS